ncbi:MAG: hypothetical protein FJ299_02625 [Planctomycetes bacterium]|nr:hypothetical protein [Planctomycetota bacterium]
MLFVLLLAVCALQAPLPSTPQQPAAQALDARLGAEGAALLERMADAYGGRDAWRAQGGAAWDQLETLRVEKQPGSGQWSVHSRVPRRAVFDPLGQGWLLSEYARYDEPSARVVRDLYRQVRHAEAAWAEHAGLPDRAAATAARARDTLQREFLLGALPFALPELGARVRELEPVVLGERRALRIALLLDTPLSLQADETVTELELFVDAASAEPLRLAYTASGSGPAGSAASRQRAWIDFSGRIQAGKVFLPALREHHLEQGARSARVELARTRPGTPDPAGLRRPWVSGRVWDGAERALSWDPPAAESGQAVLESMPAAGR